MKLTYEAILKNPELLEQTLVSARRERAAAFHALIVLPITHLFHG